MMRRLRDSPISTILGFILPEEGSLLWTPSVVVCLWLVVAIQTPGNEWDLPILSVFRLPLVHCVGVHLIALLVHLLPFSRTTSPAHLYLSSLVTLMMFLILACCRIQALVSSSCNLWCWAWFVRFSVWLQWVCGSVERSCFTAVNHHLEDVLVKDLSCNFHGSLWTSLEVFQLPKSCPTKHYSSLDFREEISVFCHDVLHVNVAIYLFYAFAVYGDESGSPWHAVIIWLVFNT